MKKLKFIFPLLVLSLFSCDDYLDINQDPNNVQFEDVPPRLILPGAMNNAYRVQNVTMNQMGNVLTNSWAGNVNSFTGGYAKEFQLNVDATFYNGIWDGLFRATKNFQTIINFDNADHSQDYYIAIAKILKAHYMQYLVDLYGDLPYDEAFQDLNNITPAYNDDQYVYRQLLGELDDARDIIANSTTLTVVGNEDIMFSGDMNKWYEFANTIELRMLLRMSNNTGAVATYRDTRLANLSGATFLSSDARINPGYGPGGTDEQLNPFYGNYLTDAAGTRLTNNRFVCASGHMRDFLNGTSGPITVKHGSGVNTAYNYPGVVDPRRGRIWTLVSGSVKGVPQGFPSGTPGVDSPTPSRLGTYAFTPYLEVPIPGVAVYADFLPLAAASGYVMTAMESYFLQAEAALRYPAYFSNAQSSFNNAIAWSFAYTVVPAANYTAYMTAISTKVGLGWTGSDTDKLQAIMTQKWIALTNVHGAETYIDYIRTGFPITPLAATASFDNKPLRLSYPLSEYTANTENVPVIAQADFFVVNEYTPFWQQGDPALGN